LVPTLVFSHHSSQAQFGSLVLGSLQTTSELLPISLSTVLDVDLADKLASVEASRIGTQGRLAKSLKTSIHQLRPVLNNHRLEFRRSRVASSSFEVLVSKLRQLNRNPLLGPTSHVPGERIQTALQRTYENFSGSATPRTSRDSIAGRGRSRKPSENFEMQCHNTPASSPIQARHGHSFMHDPNHHRSRSTITVPTGRHAITTASRTLVKSIQQALHSCSTELADVCEWSTSSRGVEKPIGALQAKDELESALADLQLNLAILLNDLGSESHRNSYSSDSARTLYLGETAERDHFRLAFYMTALLDLAKDILELLNVVITISRQARPSKRIFLPLIPGMSRLYVDAGNPTAEHQPGVPNGRLD
jgi:hypothetical protein